LIAIQRGGELLLELKAQPGKRTDLEPTDGDGDRLPTRKEAAVAAGLSNRQAREMIEVARIPTEQFDELVECDDPATVTELAKLGTKKRPKVLAWQAEKSGNRAEQIPVCYPNAAQTKTFVVLVAILL
jgi:hypothetical protein